MKKVILAMALVLVMCASSYAADPVSQIVSTGNYSNPTSSSTRMNIDLSFKDEFGSSIYEPERLIKVWARFRNNGSQCGTASTTATLTTYNGMTVVMKKDLDYTFAVPMMNHYWSVEVNMKITAATLMTNCFEIAGYGPDGNALPY